jgi:hypothetical protein
MHLWWKIKSELERDRNDFKANLRIIQDYGALLLVLLLENNSSRTVWVEEAVVVLADLGASWQTSIEIGQAKLLIRQNVGPSETLEVSPVNAIYEAAGMPQGRYSSLLHVDVRYRLDEKWSHKSLGQYKIEMGALMLRSFRHSRWYEKKVKPTPQLDSVTRFSQKR